MAKEVESRELVQLNATAPCAAGSVCEACGQGFDCGAQGAGCWCTEVQLTEQQRADLRERYRGCLCRPCLERFAAARELPRVG
jgi:hypothetical protein